MPVSEIADRLGCDPSTIYRDIKRNRYTDDELPELNGYHALVAQDKYEERRAIHRKMIVHPELKAGIEDRQSKPIMEALIQGLAPLSADASQSITFDRGTAFSAWQRLRDGIGADCWFCDPQAPYQKVRLKTQTTDCGNICPAQPNRRR